MKRRTNKKSICFAITIVLILISHLPASSYPPDNAAILYYKAFMLYQADETMNTMLTDVIKDRTKINETVKDFVGTNQKVIDILLNAAEIQYCDWAIDYSLGYEAEIPHPFKMREVSRLMLARAKILSRQGDHSGALLHCVSGYKMGRHTGDVSLISYMVGVSIAASASNCVMDILSDMQINQESLTLLKKELVKIEDIPFSLKSSLIFEKQVGAISMTREKVDYLIEICSCSPQLKEKLRSAVEANGEFLAKSRQYWDRYMEEVIAACELPYRQGYYSLEKLEQKPDGEAKTNPEADLTMICAPTLFHKAFSLSVRLATQTNAIQTAIELYLIKAQTGKLPDTLPAGMPKDLFSDKDFEYEKNADGFVLRCQGKDLGKDEIYEYPFKVK